MKFLCTARQLAGVSQSDRQKKKRDILWQWTGSDGWMGSRKFDKGNVDNFEREVNYVQLSSSLSAITAEEEQDYNERGSSAPSQMSVCPCAVYLLHGEEEATRREETKKHPQTECISAWWWQIQRSPQVGDAHSFDSDIKWWQIWKNHFMLLPLIVSDCSCTWFVATFWMRS